MGSADVNAWRWRGGGGLELVYCTVPQLVRRGS